MNKSIVDPPAQWDAVVIGAGAAGLMCALIAGQRGRRVLVLEKSNKVGKKILMSGGGRCNFTNLYTSADNFLSQNPHFCKSALSRYTQWDFIEMVTRHQIPFHEKTLGQLFCDNSSKDILNMLISECEKSAVEIRTHCTIQSVQQRGNFILRLDESGNTVQLQCESLVVASGGLSIPSLGGSDFGYQLAKQFDHSIHPLRAGLVPFTITDSFKAVTQSLSGISVPARVSFQDQFFDENILFSHRGLSGPAILQISNYWQSGHPLQISLLPGIDIFEYLLQAKQSQPSQLLRNVLSNCLPRKLVLQLELSWWPQIDTIPMAQLSHQALQKIAADLNNWQFKPAGTEGYRTAEVTLGGVDTAQLSSKTMMSQHQSGLYFIGEVVDVTGHLGGHNFQWAWSSGHAAGLNI